MTRDFATIGRKIENILRNERKINDVKLMIRLGFNPETWRHWRAKFVELFEIRTFSNAGSDSEVRIVYDKKQKLWTIQDA